MKASVFNASSRCPTPSDRARLRSPLLGRNESLPLFQARSPSPERLRELSSQVLRGLPLKLPAPVCRARVGGAAKPGGLTRSAAPLVSPGYPSRRAPAPGAPGQALRSATGRGGPKHCLRESPSPEKTGQESGRTECVGQPSRALVSARSDPVASRPPTETLSHSPSCFGRSNHRCRKCTRQGGRQKRKLPREATEADGNQIPPAGVAFEGLVAVGQRVTYKQNVNLVNILLKKNLNRSH